MYYFLRAAVCALPLFLALTIQIAHGADIAQKIRQGNSASGFLEIGFAAVAANIPIVGWASDNADNPTDNVLDISLTFNGRVDWRGLFAESYFNSFNALALGYTPWNTGDTSIDLLVSDGLGPYEPGIGAFQSVNTREADLVAGIRATHHFDNTLVQLEAYSDVSDRHDGQTIALQVGKFRQIKNWNLHGLLGARYFSDKMLNYYFGITDEESTDSIPRYEASGGTLASLEIGATIPLNEKWVFKATAEGLYLPDSVTDSPLADGRVGVSLSSFVSYVF